MFESCLYKSIQLMTPIALLVLLNICATAIAGSTDKDISCGMVISKGGQYTLKADKVCEGNWISVIARNVKINMSGYSVSYGQTDKQSHAVELIGDASWFELRGHGEIISSNNSSHAIYSNNKNIHGLSISNISFNMYSDTADAIRFTNSPAKPMDIDIHDINIKIQPYSSGDVSGIYFDGGAMAGYSGNIYNNTIELGVKADRGRPSAIAFVFPKSRKRKPLEIFSNKIKLNGQLNNGIRLYGSDGFVIRDNQIIVTKHASNAKPIQLDGRSSNNEVYSNNIDINSTDITSSSYAIRIRFDASNNRVHSNQINIEDSNGAYPAYGIALGATEGGNTSNANLIYGNKIIGSAKNIPILLYEDSGQIKENVMYDNKVINTGAGPCVMFYPVTEKTPVYNLIFDSEQYSTKGKYLVLIPSYSKPGSLINVKWCNSNISSSQVKDENSVGGWNIYSNKCFTEQ